MSKNIEINIQTSTNTYEPLYPKTLASNISGILSKAQGGTGTTNTNVGTVFYTFSYTGTGSTTDGINIPILDLSSTMSPYGVLFNPEEGYVSGHHTIGVSYYYKGYIFGGYVPINGYTTVSTWFKRLETQYTNSDYSTFRDINFTVMNIYMKITKNTFSISTYSSVDETSDNSGLHQNGAVYNFIIFYK